MANLPKEYQEVEYIESTGTQYINTGVYGNQDTKFVIKFTRTGNYADSSWNGTGASNRNDSIRVATAPSGTTVVGGFGNLSFRGTGEDKYKTPYGQFREVYIDKNEMRYDGVKLLDINYTGAFTSSKPIWLAGCSNSTYSYKGKVAYARIYQSDVLTRDFIPCIRKSDNKKGMYDLVNKKFYTNANTGADFIAGPDVITTQLTQLKKHYIAVGSGGGGRLPAEYQEVEYLEGDGSQYINTEVIPTTETKAEFIAQVLSHKARTFEGIFGSRTANNANAFCFGISTSDVFFSQFDNATRTGAFSNYDLNKHSYAMSKDGLYQDNNLITTYSSISAISSTKPLLIMGVNSEDAIGIVSTSQRSYGTKIYESNVITREMVPCYRKSDNLAGMYDLQNTGKNLVGIFEYVGNTLSASNGQLSANASYSTTEYVAVKPNTTYTWRRYSPVDGTIARLCEYTDNKTYTSRNTLINITKAGAGQVTFTTGSTTAYIRLSKRNTDTQIQLEEGSVATTYEPYPFYVNAGTGEFEVGKDIKPSTQQLVELKSMYVVIKGADVGGLDTIKLNKHYIAIGPNELVEV